jgi:hypothetical protein
MSRSFSFTGELAAGCDGYAGALYDVIQACVGNSNFL